MQKSTRGKGAGKMEIDQLFQKLLKVSETSIDLKEYEEEKINVQLEIFKKCIENVSASKNVQHKLIEIISQDKIDELILIFQIISNADNDESSSFYLVAILVQCLDTSLHLWKNIIKIITLRKYKKCRKDFDIVVSIKVIHQKFLEIIDQYFKSLSQIGNTFYVDTDNIPEDFRTESKIALPVRLSP